MDWKTNRSKNPPDSTLAEAMPVDPLLTEGPFSRDVEMFRQVVEWAPTAMVVVDVNGRIVLVNAQMEHIFGYGRDELLGQPVEILIPGRFSVHHMTYRHEFIAAASPRPMGAGRDLYARRRDGSEFPVEIGLNPVGSGAEMLVLAAVVDISERKQAEEQIHRLNAELERRVEERTAELQAANQELDAFAYAVSHDLRAPLRAMNGFSHALIEDYGNTLTAEAREYLEEIIQAGTRMGKLIDGILALSRTTRGELQRDEVDLSALAGQVSAELARSEPGRQVSWQIEPGLKVRGDARMLEVVMMNLFDNAWKYTAKVAEPIIRFFGVRDDGGMRFCVADNGIGFEMRHAGMLFKPFQRLHRQDEFPGIGIGLATVKRIIHRHGGTIEATAAPGQGATFCFTLASNSETGESS